MIVLSERLKAVAGMVSKGGAAVDIGTDHAYIPIYLVEKGIKDRAIAGDVNSGPLDIARKNIEDHDLAGRITLCLSDGLANVEVKPGDSVIIAGMGGLLVKNILSRSEDKARKAGELILQPQSEYSKLRQYLCLAGFRIIDEDAVFEDGKFYFVIKAGSFGNEVYVLSEAEKEFGPVLLSKKHPVLKDYLRRCLEVEKEILAHLSNEKANDNVLRRMRQVVDRISLIKGILRSFT